MADRPAFAGWLGDTNDITRMFLAAGRIPGMINMAGGLPEPAVYPVKELANLAARSMQEHPADCLNYSPIEGLPELRDAIAARFRTASLKLARENVLITSGGQQVLELTGKVLLDAGDLIAAQSPAYLGALNAWQPRLPAYRPIRIDSNKFDATESLEGAKFAYMVPNFSNPTGRLVTEHRRRQLVDAAHETGTWLLEDDPYGALYFDGAPLDHMLTLSGEKEPGPYRGPVIYAGTLSKEIAPGFRVGWAIAAPEMIEALTFAKQGSDMSSGGLNQRIALEAIESGLLERTLPTIIETYRSRRDVLCAAMQKNLTPWFDWEVPSGGMFVWATARHPEINTDTLLEFAMEDGVCISPSSVFDPEGRDRSSIRLNFTVNPSEKLEEGTRRLAKATQRLLARIKSEALQPDPHPVLSK